MFLPTLQMVPQPLGPSEEWGPSVGAQRKGLHHTGPAQGPGKWETHLGLASILMQTLTWAIALVVLA